MKSEVATLEYEYTGQTPREISHSMARNINVRDNGGIRNGRPFVTTGRGRGMLGDQSNLFKEQVKAYHKGDINKAHVTFPLRFGSVSYITTIPTRTYINLLFRHDSCIANNYRYDESDEHPSDEATHHQPPVYFLVKINTETGSKDYTIVNSRWLIEGRVFPHNDSGGSRITSGYCDGDYGSQMQSALRSNDLSIFISLFSMYILNGTRSTDEYGRSCENFYEGRNAQMIDMTLETSFDATLAAFVFNDPEEPHGMRMDSQQMRLMFKDRAVEDTYYDKVCEFRNAAEVAK